MKKNLEPQVACHEANIKELQRELRLVQEQLDTLGSPLWKRLLYRLDGWGPWWVIRHAPAWRPWRRWYRS